MAIQKNEFFEIEKKKIMEIHKKHSVKDGNGKVYCFKCPYGASDGYYCDCLFAKQIEKVERNDK